jgi:biotin carboxylase
MNQYTDMIYVLGGLAGNEPTHLGAIQLYLLGYLPGAMVFWWTVLACTLATVITLTVRDIVRQRRQGSVVHTSA